MENITRCQNCILPTSLPSVRLDEHGVCNHCRNYERYLSHWHATREKRHKTWAAIVESAKKKRRRYDCMVPLSGGKDSVYALYACSKVYGMRCLAVTFNNAYMSQPAIDNIRRALDACDADHVTIRISRPTQLQLYRTWLERCGSFCAACMRGIHESIESASRAFNVPLVVMGSGPRVSYLYMLPELFQGGDKWLFSRVAAESPVVEKAGRLGAILRIARMPKLLFRIERKLLQLWQPINVNLYDYVDVTRAEVLKVVSSEVGWQQTSDHFEHTDCRVHSLVGYIHRLRFKELSPETAHLSGRVRMGELTREEAMELETEVGSNQAVPAELEMFLKDIAMSKKEFDGHAANWQSPRRFST